jgi:hypothetical protein
MFMKFLTVIFIFSKLLSIEAANKLHRIKVEERNLEP